MVTVEHNNLILTILKYYGLLHDHENVFDSAFY